MSRCQREPVRAGQRRGRYDNSLQTFHFVHAFPHDKCGRQQAREKTGYPPKGGHAQFHNMRGNYVFNPSELSKLSHALTKTVFSY